MLVWKSDQSKSRKRYITEDMFLFLLEIDIDISLES